jgi:hypothetical protein
MKGFIATALVITGLIGFVAIDTAHAQVTERMRFTTSFPFVIGKTQFGPGTYTVSPIDDNDLNVLRVTNGHQTAFFTVISEGVKVNEPTDNELTFVRFGERYYLSEIWDALDDAAVSPATFVSDERKEPHRTVAERITIPFTKIS